MMNPFSRMMQHKGLRRFLFPFMLALALLAFAILAMSTA